MLIEETPYVLVDLIEKRQTADGLLNAAELVELFSEFCDLPCENALPADEDGDGLLLQYGPGADSNSQQTFQIDVVRQMTLAADDVDEQTIYQLHMTFYWPASPETDALGADNAWLFDGDGDQFWEEVVNQPGWQWFLQGAALDCRAEISFESVDEHTEHGFITRQFEIVSIPGTSPVVLPYQYNRQPVGLRMADPDELDPATEQELRDQIWLRIVLGMTEASEFCDEFEDYYDGRVSSAELEAYFEGMLNVRLWQQQLWGPDEPKSNLNRAFEELDANGILALEDFACCATCAAAEVWDEIDQESPQPLYLYYHEQNSERFAQERIGWVGFGAVISALGINQDEWDAQPEEDRKRRYNELTEALVRERVLPVFARHGIEVDWDGSAATNLRLVGADFYRELD